MRSLYVALAVLVGSCSVEIPNGRLLCASTESCPPGYACLGGRCFAPGSDAGVPSDVPAVDDAEVLDAGSSEPALDVACGNAHSCALTASGRMVCWGDDRVGQLGLGAAHTDPVTTPALVQGLPMPIEDMGLGDDFTCALDSGAAVYCWGTNSHGELGDPDVVPRGTALAHRVSSLSAPVALAVGSSHACAIDRDGAVLCWGDGGDGRLGNGAMVDEPTPVLVSLSPAQAIAAGLRHTCALLIDGTVWCWGSNSHNELGILGATLGSESAVPVQIIGLPLNIEAVGAFAHNTCVRAAGRLACWGRNADGELGTGAVTPTSSASATEPTLAEGTVGDFGGGGFDALFVAGHTCAVLGSTLFCWGRNFDGELGLGTSMRSPTPQQVALSEVTAVAGGAAHSCAVAGGEVYCWGNNGRGRLGSGNETNRNAPRFPLVIP